MPLLARAAAGKRANDSKQKVGFTSTSRSRALSPESGWSTRAREARENKYYAECIKVRQSNTIVMLMMRKHQRKGAASAQSDAKSQGKCLSRSKKRKVAMPPMTGDDCRVARRKACRDTSPGKERLGKAPTGGRESKGEGAGGQQGEGALPGTTLGRQAGRRAGGDERRFLPLISFRTTRSCFSTLLGASRSRPSSRRLAFSRMASA